MKKLLMFFTAILLLFSFVACKLTAIDGKTPYIQDGYWYIDGVNTGVKAEGVDGTDGKDAIAGDEDTQGLVFYPQDDGTYVVSGGNAKYMKNITIPEKYRGGDVVAIEENAFKDFTVLEKIFIPNTVTMIGQGVFSGCTALKEISMPCYENTFNFMWLCTDASENSISSNDDIFLPPVNTINITGGTAIPNNMFYIWGDAGSIFKSTLKTLTIPDSITSIGQYAFYSCPEEIFEEENGIKYIGKWAVASTNKNFTLRNSTIGIASGALLPENYEFDESITSFTIPTSIKYISPLSLLISPNIEEYVVDNGNSEYCSVDGIVYTKDMKTLVQYPIAKGGERLDFPQSVQKISSGAFYGSQIKKVTLPNDITEISESAFADCMLEEIVIPNSVTKIGESAFSGTNLETIMLPEGITEIPYGAFSGSKLSGITIPNTVTKIGQSAFSGTNISTIEIPSGVTEIGEYAFSSSNLQSITLPSGITEIADGTFQSCNMLTSINIPDSVTRIGNYAFSQSHSLAFVRLPKNLKSIGDNAFSHTPLLSINVPAKLEHIGENAFSGCNIIEIINENNWSLNISKGSSGNGYLAYYAKEIHSGDSKIVTLGDYLFYTYNNTNYLLAYTGNDTELCLPESYNGQGYEIYRGAFYHRSEYYNTPIYSIVIPDCVTNIGDLAFGWCENLKEIVIGKSVTNFGNQAFDGCFDLEKVFYKGTETSWNRITQYSWMVPNYIKEAPRYYYSETAPTDSGNYWHYVNGVPTIWE